MEKNQNYVPEYAKVLGKGKFAGMAFATYKYECPRCHKRKSASLGTPRCNSCGCMMIRVG